MYYMMSHRVLTNNGLVYILHSIVDDMDEPTNKLIGRHSYCTQVKCKMCWDIYSCITCVTFAKHN